jgi:hypothetical protein
MLPMTWFDAEKCDEGMEALRQYQREYDEDKKAFRQTARHDWCSHFADSARMLAIVWRQEPAVKPPDKLKPLIVGPGNEVTLDDMWATHQQFNKRKRL